MLGKAGKLGILARSSEDLGVACSDRAATLAFERTGYDCCPAGLGTGADEFVHELDKLVREANCDLLAHPIMVPVW
jgi:hypothetical protein